MTAVAAGSATITGTYEGQSDSVGITVPLTVTNLTVCCFTTLAEGQTTTYTATATYSDGTTATVTPTWSSTHTPTATVSSAGLVTAVALDPLSASSSVGIRATYGGQTDQLNVIVIPALE